MAHILRAPGTVYAVAWQPASRNVSSNSMGKTLRKAALARKPTTTFCCKDSQLPDVLQVAPDVDAALKEQLEEMGFSAHRCEPWETLT